MQSMTQIQNAGQVKQCPVYLRFYSQHNIPLNGQEWSRMKKMFDRKTTVLLKLIYTLSFTKMLHKSALILYCKLLHIQYTKYLICMYFFSSDINLSKKSIYIILS